MHIFSLGHLTHIFVQYGYLAVFVGLLAEGAGIPVPGETVLLIASALAARPDGPNIAWIVVIAFSTTVTGDNIGFYVGHAGGPPLLERYGRKFHIRPRTIQRGRDFIRLHGSLGVFCARFIAGLRVLNGLVAGSLLMSWPRFFLFDLLGAGCWVGFICSIGYIFGNRLSWLVHLLGATGLILLVSVLMVILVWVAVHKYRRRSVTQ